MIMMMMRPKAPQSSNQTLANKARPRASSTKPRRSSVTWGAPSRRPLMRPNRGEPLCSGSGGPSPGDGAVLPARHGSSPTAGFRQPVVDTPRRPWARLCPGLDDPRHRIRRREGHTRFQDATSLRSPQRGLSLAWDVVEVLDDGSGRRCVSRLGRVGPAYAAPSATDGAGRITQASARPHTRKLRAKKLPNQKLYTLNSPPTVSSAWRSCVPQAARQSPRSLRLVGANAPYPNPSP